MSNLHETNEIRKYPKSRYTKHWFTPPKLDPTQRYERALWWVQALGASLIEAAEVFKTALDTQAGEDELARARATVAADRSLFSFWASRLWKLGKALGVDPGVTAGHLAGVLAGLEAAGEAYGPLVGPVGVEGAVRACTRRTDRSQLVGGSLDWDKATERVEGRE